MSMHSPQQSNVTPHPVVDLKVSDLVVGRIYAGPDKSDLKGMQNEPLSKLLFACDPETGSVVTALKQNGERSPVRLTNAGGIRRSISLRDQNIKSGVALVSTSKEPEWQDEVQMVDGVRQFVYHGDSRVPGDPDQTPGNKVLLSMFKSDLENQTTRANTPLLLAFKNTTGKPHEYEFLGVAVPGSPAVPRDQWVQPYTARNEAGEEFYNYKYVFTLLDCQKVDGVWVRAAFFGLTDLVADRSPQELRDWVSRGERGVSNTMYALGAADETVKEMGEADRPNADFLVERLRSRLFAGNLSAVNPESNSAEIYKKEDFVDGSWFGDVTSLLVARESEPNVVVLLGGPGNGKSALAQCLITAAEKQGMCPTPSSSNGGAARRIIKLVSANEDGKEIRIVNDASIPATDDNEKLHSVLKWVAESPQNRKALLCVNRGALVEEVAELDRSGNGTAANTLRSLSSAGTHRPSLPGFTVHIKVIEMDNESTLEKMINNKNRGPWGELVRQLKDSFAADPEYNNSVFHQNAKELDTYLFGFYHILLEAEQHRGLKMTYRDIWSAVGAFLIGSEEARQHKNPRDVLKNGKTTPGLIGYCSLYGHGWLRGETEEVDVSALSPVEESLRTTDPAAKVTAAHCTTSAIKSALTNLHKHYPVLAGKGAPTTALETALAYRMAHLRDLNTISSSASQAQSNNADLNCQLAIFGHLKDATELYNAGFNVLGKPKKACYGANVATTLTASDDNTVLRWSDPAAGCVVTVHASSDFRASAELCTGNQIGLRAESASYVHALDRVGRARSLHPTDGINPTGRAEDISEHVPEGELQAPQQIPIPEMLISDVLMEARIGYAYNGSRAKSDDSRVFHDKDGKEKNIKSKLPDESSFINIKMLAGVDHWSDLSAPSRLRGTGAGALPLTPSLAIMQRQRAKLPNFAAILQYLYREGSESLNKRDHSAAYDGLAIVTTRILRKNSSAHPGLSAIETQLSSLVDAHGTPVYSIYKDVPASRIDTSNKLPMPVNPCEWFVVSLAALDRLAGRIPPVVCAEWLTAIYRTAFGMGYLHVYTVTKKTHPAKDDLFSWTSSERSMGERAVLGVLRKLVSGNKRWDTSANNRYEAVCYMLQNLSADDQLHVLTKSSGKASGVPEPGLGWLDMVVTLAANIVSEDSTVELYYVHEYIKALRVQPPMAELIRLCARNGLLTGAVPPDADGALKVYTPYTPSGNPPSPGTGQGARGGSQ